MTAVITEASIPPNRYPVLVPPIFGSNGDETGGVSTFSVSGSASVNEGDSGTTNFQLVISRSGALSAAAQVSWAVTGTGPNAATAADFIGGVFPSGIATFAENFASAQINIPIVGDAAEELSETFSVTLSLPLNTALIQSPGSTVVTINNDDSPDPASLSFNLNFNSQYIALILENF